MRRTRKWSALAQEAKRLADLGLSGYAIAKKLEVEESTVSRWVKTGKLTLKNDPKGKRAAGIVAQGERLTPEQWAAAIRRDYALDATDDQLVTMAEAALGEAVDATLSVTARNQSRSRFQALVRQLNLIVRAASQAAPEAAPKTPALRSSLRVVRPSGDPRRGLMAANE